MRRTAPLAAVAFTVASAAHGAPALVENIDEPTRHPYQQTGANNCSLAGDCEVAFPAVTAGETLLLHASCSFSMASTGAITSAILSSSFGGPADALPVFTYGTFDGVTNYVINASTYLFSAKGDQPRLDVFAASMPVQGLVCTISGYSN